MKTILFSLLFLLITLSSFAQSKSKKELKEETRKQQIARTDSLVNSRAFVFVASTVLPQVGRSLHFAGSSYTVKVVNDSVFCSLPFYGRAYGSSSYGGDGGMEFIGKADDMTLLKKRKSYLFKCSVKGESDTYKLFFNIGFEGSASLAISSTNRSSISYHGDIDVISK